MQQNYQIHKKMYIMTFITINYDLAIDFKFFFLKKICLFKIKIIYFLFCHEKRVVVGHGGEEMSMMKGQKKKIYLLNYYYYLKTNDLSLYDCVPKDLTTQIK